VKANYDTSQDYTWALAGFNLLRSSFFSEGQKTEATKFNVCIRVLASYVILGEELSTQLDSVEYEATTTRS
jgi:hypothetical protein